MEKVDFRSMSRRDLQALCKKHSIPANSSNALMAERLAAIFSEKGNEFSKQMGPSCLKGSSGSAGGHDDGYRTRSKRKRVTFVFPTEDHDSDVPNNHRSEAAGKELPRPEPTVVISVRRTRSQTLRGQGDAENAIRCSGVGSTSKGRGARIPKQLNVHGDDAIVCDQVDSDHAVDGRLLALKHRLGKIVSHADGAPRRSRRLKDPGLMVETGAVAGAAGPERMGLPNVPEIVNVRCTRGSQRNCHQHPIPDLSISHPGSAPAAPRNDDQNVSKRGIARSSKRKNCKHEFAEAADGVLDISAPKVPVVRVRAEKKATVKILEPPRRSRRKSVIFQNEETGDCVHTAFEDKSHWQTKEHAPEPTVEDRGNLRRSKRNVPKKLDGDILLSESASTDNYLGKIAGTMPPNMLSIQTTSSRVSIAREIGNISESLEVHQKKTSMLVLKESTKQKRSVKCNAEEKVSLCHTETQGKGEDLEEKKYFSDTMSEGLSTGFPGTLPSSGSAFDRNVVLEDIRKITREPEYQSSEGINGTAKLEMVADGLVQNGDVGLWPTDLLLTADVPLEKTKNVTDPEMGQIQNQEPDRLRESTKDFKHKIFKESFQVSYFDSPAVDKKSCDSCDQPQKKDLLGFGSSIMRDAEKHVSMMGKGSENELCNDVVQSSFEDSSVRSNKSQCLVEDVGSNKASDYVKFSEHMVDDSNGNTSAGIMKLQPLPFAHGPSSVLEACDQHVHGCSLTPEITTLENHGASPPSDKETRMEDATNTSLLDDPGCESCNDLSPELMVGSRNEEVHANASGPPRLTSSVQLSKTREANDSCCSHGFSTEEDVAHKLTCNIDEKDNVDVDVRGNFSGKNFSTFSASEKTGNLLDNTRQSGKESSCLKGNLKFFLCGASNSMDGSLPVILNEDNLGSSSELLDPQSEALVFSERRSGPKRLDSLYTQTEYRCGMKGTDGILTGEYDVMTEFFAEKKLKCDNQEGRVDVRAFMDDDMLPENETSIQMLTKDVEVPVDSKRTCETSLNAHPEVGLYSRSGEAAGLTHDAHECIVSENEFDPKLPDVEQDKDDGTSNHAIILNGNREIASLGSPDLDREIKLQNEKMSSMENAEVISTQGSLVANLAKTVHPTACQGDESADVRDTGESVEILDLAVEAKFDEHRSSERNSSEVLTISSVAVVSLSNYANFCQHNPANSNCLDCEKAIANQHQCPDNESDEIVENKTDPADLLSSTSIAKKGTPVSTKIDEILDRDACDGQLLKGNAKNAINLEESDYLHSHGNIDKKSCDVKMDKHLNIALVNKKMLELETSMCVETTVAKCEDTYQSAPVVEMEMETMIDQLGYKLALSAVKTSEIQGTDPDAISTVPEDDSCSQIGEMLHGEPVISPTWATDGANMNVTATSLSLVGRESDDCEMEAMQTCSSSEDSGKKNLLGFSQPSVLTSASAEIIKLSHVSPVVRSQNSTNNCVLEAKEKIIRQKSNDDDIRFDALLTERTIDGDDFIHQGENEQTKEIMGRVVSELKSSYETYEGAIQTEESPGDNDFAEHFMDEKEHCHPYIDVLEHTLGNEMFAKFLQTEDAMGGRDFICVDKKEVEVGVLNGDLSIHKSNHEIGLGFPQTVNSDSGIGPVDLCETEEDDEPKRGLPDHETGHMIYSEVLEGKILGCNEFVDHDGNKKGVDEPCIYDAELELSSVDECFKEMMEDRNDETEVVASSKLVSVEHEVNLLKEGNSERISSSMYQIEVFEKLNTMSENEFKDHRKLEHENNRINVGLSEEKLACKPEYRNLLEQNEHTIRQAAVSGLEFLADRGSFDGHLKQDTQNYIEDATPFSVEGLDDMKHEDASWNTDIHEFVSISSPTNELDREQSICKATEACIKLRQEIHATSGNNGDEEQPLVFMNSTSAKCLKEPYSTRDQSLNVWDLDGGSMLKRFSDAAPTYGRISTQSQDFLHDVFPESATLSDIGHIASDGICLDDKHDSAKEGAPASANDMTAVNSYRTDERDACSNKDSATTAGDDSSYELSHTVGNMAREEEISDIFDVRSNEDPATIAVDDSSYQLSHPVGNTAGKEIISDIFNGMRISSIAKHSIAGRISCTPQKISSSKVISQIENGKENTPFSKMPHTANVFADKSSIQTSKRIALAKLDNRIMHGD